MRHIPLLTLALLLCACSGRAATTDQRTHWHDLMADGQNALRSTDPVHALSAVRAALLESESWPAGDVDRASTLALLADALTAHGEAQAAEATYQKALTAFAAGPGARTLAAAECRDGLVRLLVASGRATDAETLVREALAIRETCLGADHDVCALSAAMLADLLRIQGRTADASALYRRALTTWASHGQDHDGNAAAAHHGLALIYAAQGDEVQARTHLASALSILDRSQGATSPALIIVLLDLASSHSRSGDLAAAASALTRALSIMDGNRLTHAPIAADALEPLANIQAAQHHDAEAAASLMRAIAIRTADTHGDPRHLGMTMVQYAELMRTSGQANAAVTAYQAALEHWQRTCAQDRNDIAVVLNGLASSLVGCKRYTEAEPLLVQALALLEQQVGTNHEDLLVILGNQAQLYSTEEKWPQAVAVGTRMLGILESHGGTDRREYVEALNTLIGACAAGCLFDQAITLNRRAITIVERSLGTADPNLATSLQNCAALLKQVGQAEEAAHMDARASAILAKAH